MLVQRAYKTELALNNNRSLPVSSMLAPPAGPTTGGCGSNKSGIEQ